MNFSTNDPTAYVICSIYSFVRNKINPVYTHSKSIFENIVIHVIEVNLEKGENEKNKKC